jgi:hypothetical protein
MAIDPGKAIKINYNTVSIIGAYWSFELGKLWEIQSNSQWLIRILWGYDG